MFLYGGAVFFYLALPFSASKITEDKSNLTSVTSVSSCQDDYQCTTPVNIRIGNVTITTTPASVSILHGAGGH